MSFVSKNLQSKQGGLTFIKGATLFFLGMSAVLFLTQAFDIVPSVTNRAQLIKEVLFTADGSQSGNTGAYIDGSGGNAYFAGTLTSSTMCLAGDTCRSTWPAGGESLWSTGTNGIYYTGGNVGIGTTGPADKLDIGLSNGNSIRIGESPSDFTPRIFSNSGLYIASSQQTKILSSRVTIGNYGITVNGGYMGGGNTNRVGIGMSNPSELFEVAQDGKSKFGDNLKLYSVGTFGVMESSNKLQFNTSGTIPRMTIDAAGFVGINQEGPTANLDVVGTVKMLSSMKYGGTTGNGSPAYTGGLNRYFPEGVLTGSLNNAVSTDTIRYLSCNTMTGGFFIAGFTGSNVSIDGLNMYFLLPSRSTTTYNLKAGETFAVLSSCDDKLVVYRQNIGKDSAATPPSSPYIDSRIQTAANSAVLR